MLTMKQIVVPTDFSPRCLAAAKHSACLAKHFGATLTFLHVVDPESRYGELHEPVAMKKWEERVRSTLREFALEAAHDLSAEQVVLLGDPAREIEDFVERKHADLVVLATRGRGPFRKFLLGSLTSKILHDIQCPVLSGAHLEDQPPFQPALSYRRIGCAVDLSQGSENVLRWAGDFARAWGAELVVIHATPLVEIQADNVNIVTVDWRDMIVSREMQKAHQLLDRLGLRAELCIGEGHPAHFVSAAAAELRLDALVIGRGGAAQRTSRLPSHAYGIIRESPCPVISLP